MSMSLYGRVCRYWRKPSTRGWAKVVATTLFFAAFLVVGITGITEIEKNECRAWKKQAGRNINFYLVGWQADQCRVVGISVEGIPVRR